PNLRESAVNSSHSLIIPTHAKSAPSPWGEGWGEGDRDVRTELIRLTRPRNTDHGTRNTKHASHAFSLIEILVVVALLTVIILGLLAMFHQVQKAFRESMTQVDVLEAGRATLDKLGRELSEAIPSQLPYSTASAYRSTNFFA